ncbi:MAG: glycosyltransferase family 4 protein [Nitrospirae bacterium]|nr:glycosyltransferase family 4 protein [Nitrospirota bacterium]
MKAETLIISPYGVGGSVLYLQHLADALGKKQYPVMFCLPEGGRTGIKNSSWCRQTLKDPSTSPAFLRVRVLKYLYHLLKYFHNALAIRPEGNIKVAHLLFPFYLADFITVRRLGKRGIRVILTVHEVIPHRPFLGGMADRKILKCMYDKSDLLLVHSDSLRDELLDAFAIDHVKVRVVPHGFFSVPQSPLAITALKEKYFIPSDKKVLLFFGSIRDNKGLDVLLNVMPGIEKDFFLLIAGQTAGASERPVGHYEDLIVKNGVNGSVRWVNRYISEEECREVFKIADAVVLPYKKTFHAQSGVLNLAVGYERPCIVSDVGGIGETVRAYDLGIVVRPEDAHDLQRGVREVFEVKNSFGFDRYKNDNNWDKVCDKLIGAYEELLAT